MDSLMAAAPHGSVRGYLLDFHKGEEERIGALLDSLGNVLEDRAASWPDHPTWPRLRGRDCFSRPLADPRQVPVCMCFDPEKVRQAKHMQVITKYLKLQLGSIVFGRGHRKPVREWAHRVVLWAVYGPPPCGMAKPVAMHICNNPACLNPEHIIWGEDAANKKKQEALTEAAKQLREQRDLDLGGWMTTLNLAT
jgi:hypothetical protein